MGTASLRLLAALVMLATLVALGHASAANLGPITAPQTAVFAQPANPGNPSVVVWENFDGTNGAALRGTSPDGGVGTFIDVGGWSISGDEATASTTAAMSLTIPAAVTDAAAEAQLSRNGATTWDAGLSINADGSSSLVVRYSSAGSSSIGLWSYNGSYTLLTQATNLHPSGAPASVTVRAEAVGPDIVVLIDGASVLAHTLSAGDVATYKAAGHDRFGLWSESDSTTTFDDFHIDIP